MSRTRALLPYGIGLVLAVPVLWQGISALTDGSLERWIAIFFIATTPMIAMMPAAIAAVRSRPPGVSLQLATMHAAFSPWPRRSLALSMLGLGVAVGSKVGGWAGWTGGVVVGCVLAGQQEVSGRKLLGLIEKQAAAPGEPVTAPVHDRKLAVVARTVVGLVAGFLIVGGMGWALIGRAAGIVFAVAYGLLMATSVGFGIVRQRKASGR